MRAPEQYDLIIFFPYRCGVCPFDCWICCPKESWSLGMAHSVSLSLPLFHICHIWTHTQAQRWQMAVFSMGSLWPCPPQSYYP